MSNVLYQQEQKIIVEHLLKFCIFKKTMSNYMGNIFNIALPVISIIIIGFIFGKIFKKSDTDIASKLALYVFAPVMTIQVLRTGNIEFDTLGRVAIIFFTIQIILAVLIFALGKTFKTNKSELNAHFLTVLFTNCGYYGFPIILLTYGEKGLIIAVEYVLFFNLMTATLGVFLASETKLSFSESIKEVLKIPLIYAFIIGLALNITKTPLPKLIDSTLVSLNSAAIPVLLTVLGLELSRIDVKSNAKSVSLLVGERLILGPVIAIITILLIPLLNGLSAKVVVLESAMPTAFNALLLAKELGGNYKIVATTVFLTTLLSPFTLSLFVLLLDKIFL